MIVATIVLSLCLILLLRVNLKLYICYDNGLTLVVKLAVLTIITEQVTIDESCLQIAGTINKSIELSQLDFNKSSWVVKSLHIERVVVLSSDSPMRLSSPYFVSRVVFASLLSDVVTLATDTAVTYVQRYGSNFCAIVNVKCSTSLLDLFSQFFRRSK